ncbi:rod shape-determining protein [Alicyclobacillus dauci]|uniref:Cell shape-determining protein MreB n=1 Tax=Alicyclobacillus dauci TaxID=1475485 RepID=A0ABY6YXI8_9BACL|nr:rod shape-determining protein [Alicyclobacillus dauci]WAH35252.1 rod shape-determining protein [Alicyclobacillus dauci]
MLAQKTIGIDLGTTNTVIYIEGKGVLLREQSVVAFNSLTETIEAVGDSAKEMIGRAPQDIKVIRPLERGVVTDFHAAAIMIRQFLKQVIHSKSPFITKPQVTLAVPTGATAVEKQAAHDVAIEAGAKQVHTIEKSLAAAIGAGLSVSEPKGNMVVHIGAGTTEAATISLGGIVTSTSVRVGGDDMDRAITQFVADAYNLLIGDRTAEAIKMAIATCQTANESETIQIRGRDVVDGLPKSISVKKDEMIAPLSKVVESIAACVVQTLEKTPPELAADIFSKGIVLTGGGSLLLQVKDAISAVTGLAITRTDDPFDCVAIGTGRYMARSSQVSHDSKLNWRLLGARA